MLKGLTWSRLLKKVLKLRQGDQADYAEYFQNFFQKIPKIGTTWLTYC